MNAVSILRISLPPPDVKWISQRLGRCLKTIYSWFRAGNHKHVISFFKMFAYVSSCDDLIHTRSHLPHTIVSIFPTIRVTLVYIQRRLGRFSTDLSDEWMIWEIFQFVWAYVSSCRDTNVYIPQVFPPNRQHPTATHAEHSHANCGWLQSKKNQLIITK